MHNFHRYSLCLSFAALLAGCPGNGGESESATNQTTGAPTTDPTTGGMTGPTTGEPTTGGPTTDPTTGGPTTDPTTGGTTGGDGFVFDETPPDQLVQIDRMGMPAVATAVISSNLKDMYNASTPTDDAAGTYVADIVANVTGLHAALDDDLMGLKLKPCAAMDCVNQAAPLVVPDTIKIDVTKPSGFPNGRRLADPVVDITLAVVLLDLSDPMQPVDLFAKLPLNPPKNDKDFLAEFPYVAAPH